MQLDEFQEQVKRLADNYGSRVYPPERTKIYFRVFCRHDISIFSESVDDLIANNRSAPMLQEITDAIQEVLSRKRTSEAQTQRSLLETFDDLTENHTSLESKDFARACTELLKRKLKGEFSTAQWSQACDYLDDCAAGLNPGMCKACDNTGYLLFPKNRCLTRCWCKYGAAAVSTVSNSKHAYSIPVAQKKDEVG